MNCPGCGKVLPDFMTPDMRFCPYCGEMLYEEGIYYIIEVQCGGRRTVDDSMMVFVDDRELYEVKPGENIRFAIVSGFHALKFRQKVRSRTINFLVGSDYFIRASSNSLSGLIETSITKIEDTEIGHTRRDLDEKKLTSPVMVSEDGKKTFDIMLGDDSPDYEFRATSGFREGTLRIYSERCEFSPKDQLKKEVINYKNVLAIRKKIGAVDLQCDGNVHIVYSIPKDIYNEVMAFLNNRINEVRNKTHLSK